jgi:hypothetical protein
MPGFSLTNIDGHDQFHPIGATVNQTIGNASAALTSIHADARGAIISGDGSANAVRFRLDAGAATATLGIRFEGVDTIVINSRVALDNMRLIREDAADVVITVQYFK